jgi:hypothetical protein
VFPYGSWHNEGSPPAEILVVSDPAPQVGIGLSCDEKVLTLLYVGAMVVVMESSPPE